MKLCCHFHKPGRCCDPDDCSPCCAHCPDPCPLDVGKKGKPRADLSDVDGFARLLANMMHFVGADWVSVFENTDTSSYIYRVRDPSRMIFSVKHYDEERDERVLEGAYEVSVRRIS